MKKIITFIILLFCCQITYACDCDFNIISLYQKAKFVAKVKVLENHVNKPSDASNYKVDIQTLSLFKGNTIPSVYINGYNGVPPKIITSCDFSIPVNTEALIFGFENNGKIYISLCTSLMNDISGSIDKLNFLKTKANNYTSNAPFSSTSLTYIPSKIFKDYPKSFYGKSYIVKLTIDTGKTVIDVDFLAEIDVDIKKSLSSDIINKIDWKKRLENINTNHSYSFLTEFFSFNFL